ncbi:uncharacterized protein [Epargyreus clarus]|uniref:uncharacterized protein n=1 Tax=Epargyreus clarus TaxID=520877 RepID=UPI003C2B7E9A
MLIKLESLYSELKEIRVYLIKIGLARRHGPILISKAIEANKIYEKYKSWLCDFQSQVKKEDISTENILKIDNKCKDFEKLYNETLQLCESEKIELKLTMDTFDLKTAMSLLDRMTDEEANTKQLIDNIEYYSSILKSDTCKAKLIQFVLKSRLSQAAKLRLDSNYSTVSGLIKDMRIHLLTQKSAPAIQSKLQMSKQNDLTIHDYGKEITEMFTELTISQSNGNTDSYKILKPINEKFAIKKFADGLRNRRLGTIITSRNYTSLKDAIQAAKDEEIGTASTSSDFMGMYHQNSKRNYFSSTRGRQNPRHVTRYNASYTRSSSNPVSRNANYRGQYRASTETRQPAWKDNDRGSHEAWRSRPMFGGRPWQQRGRYNYRGRNQWIRNGRMRLLNETENCNDKPSEIKNEFFRE